MGAEAVLDRSARSSWCFYSASPAPIRVVSNAWRQSPQACRPCARVVCLDDGALLLPGVAIHGLSRPVASLSPVGFERFPFNHPLFVLFSSGSTGAPKCILQGAGGTLREHLKEHCRHCDLGPSDRLLFQTSTAWMMWNWQLSALVTGAAIVLYDGLVTGPETLWDIVAGRRVTQFGTSPAYLALCQEFGYAPGKALDLAFLRSVMSTGSILHDRQFEWVARAVKPVPVQSISGGTDIIG